MDDLFINIPGPAWAAIGVLGAALFGGFGTLLGNWISSRNKDKVDAGQLALELAKNLGEELVAVKARVSALENERNAYRTHAHVLHEWGGYVQTTERPRPLWPESLPR